MSILWIIEKPEKGCRSLARHLQGDFPVRLFGSIESLRHLVRLSRGSAPDAICVAVEDFEVPWRLIDEHLSRLFPGMKRVYCWHQDEGETLDKPHLSPEVLRLDWSVSEGWKVSSELKQVLEAATPTRLVHYKNIALDLDHGCVRVFPEGESVALPMKEARLLRLFIKHAGRCLSREELCNEVWGAIRVSPRTVDSHISRLRKRLSYADIQIENIYGDGYVFK